MQTCHDSGLVSILLVLMTILWSPAYAAPHDVIPQATGEGSTLPDPKLMQQTYRDTDLQSLNARIEGNNLHNRGGSVYWEWEFIQSDTRYIQVYFDSISSPPGLDYRLPYSP